MTEDMNQLLDTMVEAGAWDSDLDTLSGDWQVWRERIAQAVDRNPIAIPEDFVVFYARAWGAKFSIGNIYVFTPYVLEDVHQNQDYLFEDIPGALFFASDGGDGFFFIDTEGSLGEGAGAIFWGARGSMRPDWCVPCGQSMREFLRALVNRQKVWEGPWLETRAIESMLEALQAGQRLCVTHPGASFMEVRGVLKRLGVFVPEVLAKLLEYSNGITFTLPGVEIWPAASIQPLEALDALQGQKPSAMLIGEGAIGERYATTTDMIRVNKIPGWPERVGYIVRMDLDNLKTPLASLGYLPDVVIRWLLLEDEVRSA